jgi:hypothetical protein
MILPSEVPARTHGTGADAPVVHELGGSRKEHMVDTYPTLPPIAARNTFGGQNKFVKTNSTYG